MTEAQEQAALIQRAMLDPRTRDSIFKIPNEGKRSRWLGAKFKREGLRPGMPDICLPQPSGRYHALYIELKAVSPRGKLTQEQENCLWLLNKNGNYAAPAWGWVAAWQIIEDYLNAKL